MYTILYFKNPTCPICAITGPSIISASAFYKTSFSQIDATDDRNSDQVRKYKIEELPTIVLIKDGRDALQITGIKSVESLIQDLAPYLA